MRDWYRLAWPFLRQIDAEKAHRLAVLALRAGLVPLPPDESDPALAQKLWGLDFPNPVGLAAGFDKNAEVYAPMLRQGFGFVEIGSVTPRPQPGNPHPRLFRLEIDQAVINRMGFNNEGVTAVAERLGRRKPGAGIVGANLGKNKTTEDAAADYVLGVKVLGGLADYFVINVSSPNTPGLRALQGKDVLRDLVARVAEQMEISAKGKPLLLKIAPDLTDDDKRDIADVALAGGLDGLIVSNTTITRPDDLRSSLSSETGGLSGAPLFDLATATLRDIYALTQGKLPLIGVGGISSGRQAYAKIRAGASLVQLYSALTFEGPALVTRIKRDLLTLLRADGFSSITQAVGADHK